MHISKNIVTLTSFELETAIKEFFHKRSNHSFDGGLKITRGTGAYSGYRATFTASGEIGIDLSSNSANDSYRLRHKKTGLYLFETKVVLALGANRRVGFICNKAGKSWSSLDDIFKHINSSFRSIKDRQEAIELGQEELLGFEIVRFGEAEVQDIVFHMDLVRKLGD